MNLELLKTKVAFVKEYNRLVGKGIEVSVSDKMIYETMSQDAEVVKFFEDLDVRMREIANKIKTDGKVIS